MKERELVIDLCEHQATGRVVIVMWLDGGGRVTAVQFDSYKCAKAWLAGFIRGREDGYSWTYSDRLESQRWDIMRALPSHVQEEIYNLLDAEQFIQAIKRYRDNTGWGLKEAKDAIDLLRLMRS